MTAVFSLLGFVAHLKTVEADLEHLPKAIVARACATIAKQAKAQIGKDHQEWPVLAERRNAIAPRTAMRRTSRCFVPESYVIRSSEPCMVIYKSGGGCIGRSRPRWLCRAARLRPGHRALRQRILSNRFPHALELRAKLLTAMRQRGKRKVRA
jgi:hypothetical protein